MSAGSLSIASNDPDSPHVIGLTGESVVATFIGQITGASSAVQTLAVQSDGKIIVGGLFTEINGTAQAYLARINRDGSLDVTFAPVFNNSVRIVRIISGGRILCSGSFTSVNGQSDRQRICILNPDGTLDSFAAVLSAHIGGEYLSDMVELSGGDILLGRGALTSWTINGISWNKTVARLSPAGVLDETYMTTGPFGGVVALLALDDDAAMFGGSFTSFNGDSGKDFLAVADGTGATDPTFTKEPNAGVNALRRAADGNIWVGGTSLSSYDGTTRNRLFKIQEDGTLVVSFADPVIGGSSQGVNAIRELSDGRVVVTGSLQSVDGVTMDQIGMVLSDGSRDTDWPNVGWFPNQVPVLELLDNDYILLGGVGAVGGSQTVAGESRDGLALLSPDGLLIPTS